MEDIFDDSFLQDIEQPAPIAANNNPPTLRYARLKKVGRQRSVDHRNERIVKIAKSLPVGNKLRCRGIYWFVASQPVEIEENPELFILQDWAKFGTDYLYQINYTQNKTGEVHFRFGDQIETVIFCQTTYKKTGPNKRMKTGSEPNSNLVNNNNNNTNVMPVDTAQTVPTYPAVSSYVHVLLLVPANRIQGTRNSLIGLHYMEQASSESLYLYCRQEMVDLKIRHVLILPTNINLSAHDMNDCLSAAHDVVLLVENNPAQLNPIMTVKQFINFNRVHENQVISDFWPCKMKFVHNHHGTIEPDFNQLDQHVQTILSNPGLQSFLCSASCRQNLSQQDFVAEFRRYFDLWSVQKPAVDGPRSVIFLCFKYDAQEVNALSEYATVTLGALGIPYITPVVAHGSVLVYLRCPAYIRWQVHVQQKKIFKALAMKGLREIYEAFISDVDASLKLPGNEELIDELEYLKEQMINDNIDEQATPNKFHVKSIVTSIQVKADDVPAFFAGKLDFKGMLANVMPTNRSRGLDGDKKKLALLIGINKYESIMGLEGAVNDVLLMKKTLIEKFGFQEEDIDCLISDDDVKTSTLPNRKNILAAFADLVDRAKKNPGAVVAIHYSGHGSVQPNANHPTGQNETIVPCDSGRLRRDGGLVADDSKAPPSTDIIDEEIRHWLSELSNHAAHVSVMFDSCHAESVTRSPTKLAGARIVPHDSRLGSVPSIKNIDHLHNYRPSLDNVVVIAACAYDMLAYEVNWESRSFGALTFYWCAAMLALSDNEQVTYGDIFGQIFTKFEKQTPKIEGERSWQLYGTSKLEDHKYAVVMSQEGKNVQLDCGAVHGITRGSIFALYEPTVRQPNHQNHTLTATVVFVGSTTSWATINQSVGGSLKGYRAFERWQANENSITINLPAACPENVRTKLATKFREVEQTKAQLIVHQVQPGETKEFNINITVPNDASSPAYVATDTENNIVLPPDYSKTKYSIADNLLDYARYQKHLHNHNEVWWQDEIDFVLYSSSSRFTPVNEWTPVRGQCELVEGDWVRFGVKQTTQKTLYFAIIQFDENGAIDQIYPEDLADTSPLLRTEQLLDIPSIEKAYGPVYINTTIPRPPEAVAVVAYKLYVTTEPTNYRVIEQEGYADARGVGRKAGSLKGPVEWTSKTIWCSLRHK